MASTYSHDGIPHVYETLVVVLHDNENKYYCYVGHLVSRTVFQDIDKHLPHLHRGDFVIMIKYNKDDVCDGKTRLARIHS